MYQIPRLISPSQHLELFVGQHICHENISILKILLQFCKCNFLSAKGATTIQNGNSQDYLIPTAMLIGNCRPGWQTLAPEYFSLILEKSFKSCKNPKILSSLFRAAVCCQITHTHSQTKNQYAEKVSLCATIHLLWFLRSMVDEILFCTLHMIMPCVWYIGHLFLKHL